RPGGERLDDLHALRGAVARDPVAAEHGRWIEQGRALRALGRRETLGVVQAPRPREALPALQLLDALGGGRELDAADAVPGSLAVDVERVVQRDRILRDPAHRAGT